MQIHGNICTTYIIGYSSGLRSNPCCRCYFYTNMSSGSIFKSLLNVSLLSFCQKSAEEQPPKEIFFKISIWLRYSCKPTYYLPYQGENYGSAPNQSWIFLSFSSFTDNMRRFFCRRHSMALKKITKSLNFPMITQLFIHLRNTSPTTKKLRN